MSEANDQNNALSFQSWRKEFSVLNNIVSIVTLTSVFFNDHLLLSQPNLTLPFDLIVEILCRLPVKFLLQLRCVCKLWNSLISDPKFTKKHLSLSTTHHLHFLNYSCDLNKYILTSYPLDSNFNKITMNSTQLVFPLNNYVGDFNIVGSCNGIICLADCNEGLVILCNPSIRKFNELPRFHKPRILRFDGMAYGFGYDSISDNYKVVVLSQNFIRDNSGNRMYKYDVKVHIVGTNLWKNIEEFPFGGYPIKGSGHVVSGMINWLFSKDTNDTTFIVSFDLRNESCQEILQPDTNDISWNLGVLRDCLCMIYGDDVWVMKEYRNKDSWTKLFTISHIQDPRTSYTFVKIVNIFKDDQVWLEYIDESNQEEDWIWEWESVVYDFKNDTIKFTDFDSTPEICIESMISPFY